MFKVGTVTHYFDKVGVATVELGGTLSVGDRIKFILEGEELFSQTVELIQIGYKKVDSASAHDVVALKTNEFVKTGTEIFKAGRMA